MSPQRDASPQRSADELFEAVLKLAHVTLPPADAEDSAFDGPGHTITYLRESQDFWIDEERDRIDPIWQEYERNATS